MDIPKINIDFEYAREILLQFLKMPLYKTDDVFLKFKTSLDDYIFRSHLNDERIRFLYHRGERDNKVLLVSHVDTFFTQKRGYSNSQHRLIEYPDNTIISDDPERGLGADDRAGCAILYLLKDMGHSILLLDSEEYSCLSANWLIQSFPSIANEINNHQFMIELDLEGNSNYKTYDLGTNEFKKYIEDEFGFTSIDVSKYPKGGTDIVCLAKDICGVNLSVGYKYHHTPKEFININHWYKTLVKLSEFLQNKNIPKFRLKKEFIAYDRETS